MLNFETFRKTDKFNEKNYQFGVTQEIKLLNTLRIFFRDNAIQRLPEGNAFDYFGNNKIIELKTRRYKRLAFKDTCIPKNKIDYANYMTEKDVFFIFNFIDGIYFWKYDRKLELRRDFIFDKEHLFIPVVLLKKISDTII